MINDELRKQIEGTQRLKCLVSSALALVANFLWITLFYLPQPTKADIIILTSMACIFTASAFAAIFSNLGTDELEAKNDPTKG